MFLQQFIVIKYSNTILKEVIFQVDETRVLFVQGKFIRLNILYNFSMNSRA